MPESTVRYYPVLARVLMRLGEGSIVCFRETIVSRPPPFKLNHDLMHRIITEYKGRTETCDMMNAVYVQNCRSKAVLSLERKCQRKNLPRGAHYEATTEIVIDLRTAVIESVG